MRPAQFVRECIVVCALVAVLGMAAQAGGNGPNMFGFAAKPSHEDRKSSTRAASQSPTSAVAALRGTCTTCHNAPNVGNHSTSLPLDLGLTTGAIRTHDMPLYTFRNKTTGEVLQTTDPGRALITGKWKHMSLFKGPILRGLAARAPYFHNGFAATLADVIEFYNGRFNIGLSAQDRCDLLAFLRAL
jgi:cytochrome c peroxidase